MRAVREPGGVLLIGIGMADDEVHAALAALYPRAASITVLIDTQQQKQRGLLRASSCVQSPFVWFWYLLMTYFP